MSKGHRRKPKGKRGGMFHVLLGALIGVGILLLLGVVWVILSVSGKFNPLGPGSVFALPNTRVTEDNFDALVDGATLAEVEAILGQGRAPSASDFDAICGTEVEQFTNPFFRERGLWEHYGSQGQILIWTNGPIRIMVFFHQPVTNGGRLVRKVLREKDGSVTSSSGALKPANPTPANPGPQPKATITKSRVDLPPQQPLNATPYTVAEVLALFALDPSAMETKYRGKRLKVTGTITEVLLPGRIYHLKAPDGKGQIELHLRPNATKAGGEKKLGDTLTFTAMVAAYVPNRTAVVLTNGEAE